MVDLIQLRENFGMSADLYGAVAKMRFPKHETPKTIEVTVMTLREAGMTKPATIEEIRSWFGAIGYRPMTMEEAVISRVAFNDQPDMRKVPHKMTFFFTLLSSEDGKSFGLPGEEFAFEVYRDSNDDRYGAGYGLAAAVVSNQEFGTSTRFACVKKN